MAGGSGSGAKAGAKAGVKAGAKAGVKAGSRGMGAVTSGSWGSGASRCLREQGGCGHLCRKTK